MHKCKILIKLFLMTRRVKVLKDVLLFSCCQTRYLINSSCFSLQKKVYVPNPNGKAENLREGIWLTTKLEKPPIS
jgi:hypothetical protein